MNPSSSSLRRGDLVEVKSPQEILQTLDADGTLNQMPFMPEMIPYCGKQFRVARRALKTCTSGTIFNSTMRAFKTDDVVMLEGVRCSGADHDGCQKLCMIFWRESWLRKVEDVAASTNGQTLGAEELRARLKTKSGATTYFCQASEILNFTNPISRKERFSKSFDEISSGNCGILEMARRISIWTFWKIRRIIFGSYGHGGCKTTPVESLDLQAGERVVIKPMQTITQTLNNRSYNRGLWFSPDMRLDCGREKTVERHLEKIIVDGTGEMRKMKNTVYLEDSYCSCPHVAFGGCPRGEFVYWREIWMRRKASSQ